MSTDDHAKCGTYALDDVLTRRPCTLPAFHDGDHQHEHAFLPTPERWPRSHPLPSGLTSPPQEEPLPPPGRPRRSRTVRDAARPRTALTPRLAWLLRRIDEETRNGRYPTVADIVDDGVSDGATRAALRKAWDAGLVAEYGTELTPRGGHGMSWGLTGEGNTALAELTEVADDGR